MPKSTLETYTDLVTRLTTELEAYEQRPTKASSKRLRAVSLKLGKAGVAFRKHMLELDAKK